jgi:hypothetical protein
VKHSVALVAFLFLVSGATAGAGARRTTITSWNPVGVARSSLTFASLGSGTCGPGSDVLGDLGYRCGARNLIADPCWRDGAAVTDNVVCATSPWASHAYTIRVPRLLFSAGVTFSARVDPQHDWPWALVLDDGNRCLLYQGAHDSVITRRGRIAVEYHCLRGDVFLLRTLRRGPVWHIPAVRWTGTHYRLLGTASIRRAIFASLPPAMKRQNDLAREAAAATGFLKDVLLVRLALPTPAWAYVRALAPDNSRAITTWRLVRRQAHRWQVVRLKRSPCRSRVPPAVRRQLFGCPRPQ